MIVDLDLAGRRVLLLGGGPETERKAWMFANAGALLTVASPDHAKSLRDLAVNGRIELITADTSTDLGLIERVEPPPDVVVVHTRADGPEEPEIARRARSRGCLVYVVDDVESSDFVQPALGNAGFIQVAVSTGGRSPSLARILAERLTGSISAADLRLVELLDDGRKLSMRLIPDSIARREALYELAEDSNLKALIAEGKLDEARVQVERRIRASGTATAPSPSGAKSVERGEIGSMG
jgi:precorrin-2 dehydrogenase/sirohydrochlorin ferrochelatase